MAGELIPFNGHGELAELPRGSYLASYDRTKIADQIALVRAVQGRDFGLDELEGEEIAVQHIVCHWGQVTDTETGEISDNIRTVLVGPDGTRYATRSETVRRDVARVALMLDRPLPWRPALTFRVRKVKNLAGSRKYLTLDLIGEATVNGNGENTVSMDAGSTPAPQRGEKGRGTQSADPGN